MSSTTLEASPQCTQVYDHLKNVGTLTAKQASKLYGIDRLGARIWELKKMGIPVSTKRVRVSTRHGKATVALYILDQSAA